MTTDILLHRLIDGLGVASDGAGGYIIYDTQADTPIAKLALEEKAAYQLLEFWLDGYCAGCGTGIPQHHSLCQNCLTEEMHGWGR